MASLFGTPKAMPPPVQVPAPPQPGDAEVRQAADDRMRVQQGRAANYLANPNAGYSAVDKKQKLGTV